MKKLITFALMALMIAACSKANPGDIKGKWKFSDGMPMIVEFRDGESETMGMIEKVSYKIEGSTFFVTSESGPAAGLTVRYELVDHNTLSCQLGTFRRID